jgi:peptidoglycan/LPS O-acetylase OafA/YrhL
MSPLHDAATLAPPSAAAPEQRRRAAAAWGRLGRLFELQAPGSARLLPMEGLRGFAVFLVFLQHYGTQALPLMSADSAGRAVLLPLFQAVRNFGNVGVELFFVLSGLLIYGHLVARRPAFPRFLARRARRLYPAFLCVFALALAAALAQGRVLPTGPGPALLYIAANLLFLPGLLPIPPLLTVAWSLSYEVFFYLAAAALVAGLTLDRWQERSRLRLVLALCALFAAAMFAAPPGFPARMMSFFAGMLLAEGVGVRRLHVPAWLGLAAPVIAFAVGAIWWVAEPPREVMYAIAFLLLCAACLRPGDNAAARLFAWAPLRRLGNMSYSYYLLHGLVVLAWARATEVLFGRTLSPAWVLALLPAVFAATLLPAAILFLAVERPFSLEGKAGDRKAGDRKAGRSG